MPLGRAPANFPGFLPRPLPERKPIPPFPPLQVLKLLYFAYGWTLAFRDEPLFEAKIQAWKYGPVIPLGYHNLSYYASNPIEAPTLARDEPLEEFETDLLAQTYRI